MFDFGEKVELQDLRHLTQLRLLSFNWPKSFGHDKLVNFVETLGKLDKLETLEIRSSEDLDVMQNSVPSPYLRKLVFYGRFQTLPTWVNSSSLPLVSSLSIFVTELRTEDIDILGTLPALRYVELESTVGHATQRFVVLSTDAFPCLRECKFVHVILEPRVFTRGAMPKVQKLSVGLRVSDILSDDLDVGIWNLPSLQQVNITLHDKKYTREMQAEAAIRRAADDHPNHPLTLYVK
jgi:hypothetical protein